MKKVLIFSILLLFFNSCSNKDEVEFRIYDLDIYSIPLDEEATQQEVFASFKVEGFDVSKESGEYNVHIQIETDLVTPDKNIIPQISKVDTVLTQREKFGKYLNLETSFILDEKFPHGVYKLILRAKDIKKKKNSEIQQEFNLD